MPPRDVGLRALALAIIGVTMAGMIGAALLAYQGARWAVIGIPAAPALGATAVLWIYERWVDRR